MRELNGRGRLPLARIVRWLGLLLGPVLVAVVVLPPPAQAAVTGVTVPVTVGVPLTVTFDGTVNQATLPYTTTPFARDHWEVLASTLHHSDGSAGSAMVQKRAGFSLSLVTTITDQPAVFEDDVVALDASPVSWVVTPDATTTGTVTLRLTLAPEAAPIALTLGTPRTVSLPVAHQNQVLTVPTVAGTTYLLSLSGVAFTSSVPGSTMLVYLRPPGSSSVVSTGYTKWSALLDQSTTATSVSYTATTSGDLTVLVDPNGDATGQVTIGASVLADVVTPTSDAAPVTASAVGGLQRLVFPSAGSPGGAVPAYHLTNIALSQLPGRPYPLSSAYAAVTLEQGGQTVTTLGALVAGVPTTDFPSTLTLPGFDGTKPWQLVVTTTYNTIGTFTLQMDLPAVTVTPVTSGRPTTVTFTRAIDYTRLTFTAAAGQRILVRTQPATSSATLALLDAAGNLTAPVPTTDEWQAFPDPTPTGPLTLLVQSGGAPGSVAVTVLLVTDPTYAFTDGQQQTVAWTTEQNPRITFTVPNLALFGASVRVALEVTRTTGTGWGPIQPVLTLDPYGGTETMPAITPGVTTVSASVSGLGTGTITLNPPTSASGSLLVRLRVVTDYFSNIFSGQTLPVTVTTPEQVSTLTLQPQTPARKITWAVTGSTLPLTLTFTDPTTGAVTTFAVPKGGGEGRLPGVPVVNNSYTVVLRPVGLTTGKFKITLTAEK